MASPIKSRLFKGRDDYDLETQLWSWRAGNPGIKVTNKGPVQPLELKMNPPIPGTQIAQQDLDFVVVEYEEPEG